MSTGNETLAAPYIVAPTFEFDGDDGNWSTFAIEVGTPPQSFRVVPATTAEGVFVPVPDGCEGAAVDSLENCGDLRGANDFNNEPSSGFLRNESSTWSDVPRSIYVLSDGQNLFGSGNTAVYGLDDVALGQQTGDSEGYGGSVKGQIVAGVSQANFWLGGLGLGSWPSTFSGSTYASLLVAMKNQSLVPSLSFGYTAGQAYSAPPIPGSLVLGGYDDTRLASDPAPISLPINTTGDVQTLQLGIQSITADNAIGGGTRQLLATPLYANIDSGVSQLWLPADTCDLFVGAFGLQYLNDSNYYIYNQSLYKEVQASMPTVSFTVGSLNGATVDIDFPFTAFDLNLTAPIAEGSIPYFPLRQAQNESQYTIGRVFLQEAYIIADWERGNLTVGKTVAQNSTTHVQPILAVTQSSSATPEATTSAAPAPHHGGGLAAGAIAGIVVVIIGLIAAGAGFWLFRMRRNKKRAAAQSHDDYGRVEGAPEVHSGTEKDYYPPEKIQDEKSGFVPYVHEYEADSRPGMHQRKTSELDSAYQLHEMEDATHSRELMSSPVYELEGQTGAEELDVQRSRKVMELSAARRSVKSRSSSLTAGPSTDAVPPPPMPDLVPDNDHTWTREDLEAAVAAVTPSSEALPSPPLDTPPFETPLVSPPLIDSPPLVSPPLSDFTPTEGPRVVSPPLDSPPMEHGNPLSSARSSEVPVSSIRSSDVPVLSARNSGAPLLSPPFVSPRESIDTDRGTEADYFTGVATVAVRMSASPTQQQPRQSGDGSGT